MTVKAQLAAAPAESVAVHVTAAVPTEKLEPDGGEQTTLVPAQLSLTVGSAKLTTTEPPACAGALTVMLVGQVIEGVGLPAIVTMVAELLLGFGSAASEASVAVLLILVPFATEQLTEATTVMVCEVFGASEANVTVRLLPAPLHAPGPVELHETNVVLDGRSSVTMTLAAASGPAFATTIV